MHVVLLYVVYSWRFVKDAGAVYLAFAMPMHSSKIMSYFYCKDTTVTWQEAFSRI